MGSSCKSEFNNAKTIGNLSRFCRRCQTEASFPTSCHLCCEHCNADGCGTPKPSLPLPAPSLNHGNLRTSTRAMASCENRPYGQCGGKFYGGPTCCLDGQTCKFKDDYYSGCL